MAPLASFAALAQASPTPTPLPPGDVTLYQASWLIIGIFFLMAIGIGVSMLLLQKLFQPKRPNPVKLMPYESGMPPIGAANQRYTIRYYVVAMLFVVFDIEAVFFYPWAVTFRALRVFGLVEMLLFIGILLVGYVYVIKKGALEWE